MPTPTPPTPSRRRARLGFALLAAAVLAVALALLDAFLIEPRWVATRHLTIGAQPTVRLVHITDLHYHGNDADVQGVVDRINALAPDFVCFTGDLVEEPQYVAGALRLLGGLQAPLYGVPGNHDYWSGALLDSIVAGFRATGGDWLQNRSVCLARHGVQLSGYAGLRPAGLDPAGSADHPVRSPNAPPAGAVVKHLVLTHYPLNAEELPPGSCALILAGHTHGGQIRLPGIGALLLPHGTGRYDLGRFDTAAGPLYVGAGLGTYFLHARFCNRPEIAVIRF